MADENRRIKGEVTVESDAAERVAFDLMESIAYHEKLPQDAPRQYYLELYRQCWLVANGAGVPTDVKEYPSDRR